MGRITDVVKNLLIINVIVFFGTKIMLGAERGMFALYYPSLEEYFRPYQVITHMFMHGNEQHLFFNMFALYMFGSALEAYMGAKKFLFYYLFTGFGAMALHLFVNYLEIQYMNGSPGSVWGASGSVFGLLAGYGMLFPNQRIMLLIPPIPMKAKYFVSIYAAIELFLGVSSFNTGIAHFAHLGGALFGVLLILYWRKTGNSV